MTPLQQVRIWLRRASAAERAMTLTAVVVAVALLGWLAAPLLPSTSPLVASDGAVGAAPTTGTAAGTPGTSSSSSSRGSGSTGIAGTFSTGTSGPPSLATTGTATTGVAPSGGGSRGASSAASGGSAPGAPAPVKQCTAATGQGVTASKIDIAVTLVNLAGAAGNGAVGVPSPSEQQSDWQNVADALNASGGVACRKLVLRYYSVNPLDASNTQQQCIKIAGDKPFLAMDSGALSNSGAGDCLPAQKVPLITQYATTDQVKKYYPYYLSPVELASDFYRTGYFGAQQKGYLSASSGLKKLGILYQSCRPGLVEAGRAAIRRAGVPDSAVVTYDLGCPAARQNSPTDYQQAVLAFQRANPPVTHVTQLDASGWAAFTKAASQQRYKPTYVFAEDASASDTNGAFAPDPNNLDGAINVVGFRYGEAKTPGYRPTAATARCNAIYARHGQKPVYEQGAGYGGVVCNYLWFLKALLENAPRLEGRSLAGGIRTIGSMDLSYPFGPVDFGASAAGATYPRAQWRVDRFSGACACWQVLDRTYHAPPT